MGPIRGQTRPLPVEADIAPQHVGAKLNASIHNRFDIEIIDSVTKEVKQRAQAENIICNQLWAQMFTSTGSTRNWNRYIHFGSGSGTPSASNVSLFTFLGYMQPSTSDDVYAFDATAGVASVRRKITLSESQYVGSSLTEVGIGYGTSSGTICTHAMLTDMNGSLISILKSDTDIINIYATVYVHWNTGGYSGIVFIPLSKDDYLINWMMGMSTKSPIECADFYNGSFGGASYLYDNYGSDKSTMTYSSTDKKVTLTVPRIAASDGNLSGGIKTIGCDGIEITPSTEYTVTSESIATGDGNTKDFFTDFPFLKAATIYVDGSEASSVIVDLGMPSSKDLAPYFIKCDSAGNQLPYGQCLFSGGWVYSSNHDVAYAYNPFYALGVTTFTVSAADIYASDDFVTWTKVSTPVPTAYQHCKYWKAVATGSGLLTGFYSNASGNIHFSTAPGSGSVITATYTTNVIPKDVNHVFDFSLTVQLGEHTA